jgi:NTE family protein
VTTLGDWLARAPFGLAMSSGFFSFYAHTGMLAALVARGLSPVHVAGSSAGALVAGAWAAGCEPAELAAVLARLRRADFWDPAPGAGLLAGRRFDALLREVLPADTFAACRVPVRISAFDILRRATRLLAHGDLATAIRTSGAVPGMFQPVWIDGRPHWDGGLRDRPGIAGVPAGRLLFHHITAPAPWSRTRAAAIAIPARADTITLAIDDLPRANPFRLDAGRAALVAARAATERALDQPLAGDLVRIGA